MSDPFDTLETGSLHKFSDWPNDSVPRIAAGVYTIWRGAEFIYVGMSGRGLTSEIVAQRRVGSRKFIGLYDRLRTHAAGRRSGDQFCVYVADRLVLPLLNHEDLQQIASGEHSMDAWVRRYIHDKLEYRWAECPDGSSALKLEKEIKNPN
jgi:hypothetical protein